VVFAIVVLVTQRWVPVLVSSTRVSAVIAPVGDAIEFTEIVDPTLVQSPLLNSSLLNKRFVTADRNTPELSTNVAELARVWVIRGSRVFCRAKRRSSGDC
jgi:hypothetical protein